MTLPNPLALHTWTLDTTPLDRVLQIVRDTGWDAVELRRLDFTRAADAGRSADAVVDQVKRSGLGVACVGVELGWMWARGPERARLLQVFDEQCGRAAALGAPCVMSPVDRERGDLREAAASVREVGDIAARHGIRLALEFNSQCEQVNTLERIRELMALAGHPACGLLLDTYHLGRTGATPRMLGDVAPNEIVYVQYSDVPRTGLEPGKALDRLPPGRGSVPFKEFFGAIAEKGYRAALSYEAPNPAAWARDPADVAREALAATRGVQP
jgi:sugar phosphate isomerase/epimerase